VKTRYAQVGLGARASMYVEALLGNYAERGELVGLCDSNPGRLALYRSWARAQGKEVPGYLAEDFDRLVAECQPQVVIVTTKDCYHDEYICRSLALGCDVITEKPMTISAEKCQRILDALQQTGRQLRVTFNYRYSPVRTQIKHLLMSGIVGQVLSVDFHWLLDTHHGADYFRRWHRQKANSGGLLVHKATHHFDLVNWWLDSAPALVSASGQRRFYTPEQALALGLEERSERCLDCSVASRCPFYLDLRKYPDMVQLYLDNEAYDGYYRDRCVFSAEIDIEDSVGMLVEYRNGVKMTYSLNAFSPWEGYIISFNGSQGRLEHHCQESVYVSGDGSVPGALKPQGTTIHVYPHFAPAYSIDIWQASGGHGGGDGPLLEDIFNSSAQPDPYGRRADQRAGAYSILTGIAANHSLLSGQPVRIADLVTGL
jgi:predicted dehydrogenase